MKNKLLISFILFVTILSFFTCSFASSSSLSFEYHTGEIIEFELSDELSSLAYNCVIYQHYHSTRGGVPSHTYIMFVGSNDAFDINSSHSGFISSSPCYYYYYDIYNSTTLDTFKTNINTFSLSDLNSNTGFSSSSLGDDGGCIVSYSNFDLYDENDNLVFQAPQVNKVVIPAIQQVEEIPQAMGQMMRILIPIGLIVFSIGLVIYLTRLVISRLT